MEMKGDSPVDVLVDLEQVVHHGLECELVKDGWNGVVATVDDDELRPSFVCALINQTAAAVHHTDTGNTLPLFTA